MDRLTDRPAPRLTARLVVGLAIMAGGILVALDTMDVLRAGDYLRYWPAVLIGIGIARLLEPRDSTRGGLVWILPRRPPRSARRPLGDGRRVFDDGRNQEGRVLRRL